MKMNARMQIESLSKYPKGRSNDMCIGVFRLGRTFSVLIGASPSQSKNCLDQCLRLWYIL